MAESPALPKPGDTIAAKYLIDRTIGTGGMSVVFGATHLVTGKRFAIKWLVRDAASSSTESAARFIREAQVAGRFQHPNVVEVYDVGEIAGSFYMVMDWLEGESLAARLDRTGPLSLHEACEYLIPCMQGMDDAHAAGIIHRDLKPANIFLCRASKHTPERAKVLDFGIAKLSNPSGQYAAMVTQTGMLIGTPYYLSPEQLRGQPIDHRTDIYAFGVILYQVLSGTLPFPAESFGDLVVQISAGSPPPLRTMLPDLPVGVDELVTHAMARDPRERYQDLRSLIEALEKFASRPSSYTSQRAAELGRASTQRSSLPMETPLARESIRQPPIPAPAPAPAPAAGSGGQPRAGFYVAGVIVALIAGALWLGAYARQGAAGLDAAAAPAEHIVVTPLPLDPSAQSRPIPTPGGQLPLQPTAALPDTHLAAPPPPPVDEPPPPPAVAEQAPPPAAIRPVAKHPAASARSARAPTLAAKPIEIVEPAQKPANDKPRPPAETVERNPLDMRLQ